mgnify:FL=1
MAKSKEVAEKEFVDSILSIGIERYYEMDNANSTHYCFDLENGMQRFWKNMSRENLDRIKKYFEQKKN